MILMDSAGFCDRQIPVLSTIGKGPRGEKGEKGDVGYPNFADEPWSIDRSYGQDTIVLHEGNSYTSKQFVPKGIDITNEAYWAETGNYNAQVELYRRETAAARDVADTAQGDIDTLLPKADFSSENTVKKYIDTNISKRVGNLAFDTIADMIEADLNVGDVCQVLGQYSESDGNTSYYVISETQVTADAGIYSFELSNGLYANRLYQLITSENHQYASSDANSSLAIFECAKSWLYNNDKLYYGNDGCPNSFNRVNGVNTMVTRPKSGTEIGGRYPIDCMSFVMMCLMGIGFEDSVFGRHPSNWAAYPKCSIDFSSDEVCQYWAHDARHPVFADNDEYRRVLTWEFAEYLYDRGKFYRLPDTADSTTRQLKMATLQPGDILFFRNFSNGEHPERFLNIGHCAICVGSGRNMQMLIMDASEIDSSNTIRVYWSTNNVLNNIVGYARIPLSNYTYAKKHDYLMNHNDIRLDEVSRNIATLNRDLSDWDTFLVHGYITYPDASLVTTYFPAVSSYDDNGTASYTYSRLNADNIPENFSDGEGFEFTLPVCLSPLMREIDGKHIGLSLYPTVPSQNAPKVKILSIESVFTKNEDSGFDKIQGFSKAYADNAALMNALEAYVTANMAGGQKIKLFETFVINNMNVVLTINISKISNSMYTIAFYNASGAGMVRDYYNNAAHDETYTIINPIPAALRF